MYLQGLGIHHFRSLFDTEIALKPLTVFIGPNGSGKTNLFKALQFLNDAVAGDIRTWRAYESQIDDLIWYGRGLHSDRPDDLLFSLRFTETDRAVAEYRAGFTATGDLEVLEESLLLREGDDWNPYLLRAGEDIEQLETQPLAGFKARSPHNLILRDFGPSLTESISRRLFSHMEGWRFFNIDPQAARQSAYIKEKPEDVPALEADASNLSAVLYALKMLRPPDMDAVTDALRRSLDLPVDIIVEHDGARGGQQARYGFIEAPFGEGRRVPPESASEGTIRMLAHMALLLADRSASLLCLEEPDHGLHPRRLPHLADTLRLAVRLETLDGLARQVLVTTHNTAFMDCFDPLEEADYLQVFAVHRDTEGKTNFIPATDEQFAPWLEDYRLGEAVRRNFI